MTLVLASSSPRRRVLLGLLEVPFDVVPSQSDERAPTEGEDPTGYALSLAAAKAHEVAHIRPDAVILGADTVVTIDGHILGKPRDEADAVGKLQLLRARRHAVITGVCVLCPGHDLTGSVAADVVMRDYSDDAIESYVGSGEPLDKAGAYAVQGSGGRLVQEVRGCYNTVVGLPLCLVQYLLESCGVGPMTDTSAICRHTVS